MSVESIQSACRAYMTALQALKLEVTRELDRAQEAEVEGSHGDLCQAWERAHHARKIVLETLAEHSS